MIDGKLTVSYYHDGSIKEIHQNLVQYEKVAMKQLKSIATALAEIRQGNFLYFGPDKIKKLKIKDVSLAYQLDSKGYYQPVYAFHGEINGAEVVIHIAALAN